MKTDENFPFNFIPKNKNLGNSERWAIFTLEPEVVAPLLFTERRK